MKGNFGAEALVVAFLAVGACGGRSDTAASAQNDPQKAPDTAAPDAGTPASGIPPPSSGAPPTTPPADECAGLLPAALQSPIVVPAPAFAGSTGAVAAVGRTFMLGFTLVEPQTSPLPMAGFFDVSSGTARQLGDSPADYGQGAFALYGQPAGFALYRSDATGTTSDISLWDTAGSRIGGFTVAANDPNREDALWYRFGIDPAGGTAIVSTVLSPDGSAVMTYRRIGAHGQADGGEVQIDSGPHPPLHVAVAPSGHVLVVAGPSGAAHARWLTRDGVPLTAWFETTFNSHLETPSVVEPMADGSFVQWHLDNDKGFVFDFVYRDGEAGTAALPPWLPAAGIQVPLPSGKATLVPGACDGVAVVAVSGKSCGCINMPANADIASVTADGSLVLVVPDMAGAALPDHYEIYPSAFR